MYNQSPASVQESMSRASWYLLLAWLVIPAGMVVKDVYLWNSPYRNLLGVDVDIGIMTAFAVYYLYTFGPRFGWIPRYSPSILDELDDMEDEKRGGPPPTPAGYVTGPQLVNELEGGELESPPDQTPSTRPLSSGRQ